MRLPTLACSLLLLLPFAPASADGAPGVDLASFPDGAPLKVGTLVDGVCRALPLEGILQPGGAVLLGLTPDCRVVPSLSCPPADRSDACADLRVNGLPSGPDVAALAACAVRDGGCPLHVAPPQGEPEAALPWPAKPPCAVYARHAFVDTGDTEVRVDMVWEAGCGPQAEGYYGLGQCVTKTPNWVNSACPHLHQWVGWEVAHEVTGSWYHQHGSGQDAHHTNRAGVHGDNSGATWCEFTLEFNPHSNVLLAVCGYGPF